MSFIDLHKIYKHRVNKKLLYTFKKLPFQKSNLLKAMKYSTFSGGKRLRSCFVYIVGEMFRVNIIALDVISVSVECIHSYSLIHDDLPCMDNDRYRRGKPSCHVKYGENISLLAGDALQSLSFSILSNSLMPKVSDSNRIKIISELSKSIGISGMCMGQLLDLEAEKKEVGLSDLDTINLYKTAFLIRFAICSPYLSMNDFSKSIFSILDYFSINIGLAFQIQDDILDLNKDLLQLKNEKKKTYPLIIGLDKSKEKIKKLYEKSFFALNCLRKRGIDTEKLQKLVQFIMKYSE